MAVELPRSACCLVTRDDKVLSVSRPGRESALALPGGKREPGESDRTTAARETWEETGIIVMNLSSLFEGECEGYWCTCFEAESFFGEPRNRGEGLVSWVYPAQLLQGAFQEFNRKVFDTWEKKKDRA